MLRPINIEAPTEDQYCKKRRMDFGNSSLTNISIKQSRQEYSLKKEAVTYSTTNSDNDDNDDISDKSNESEVKKRFVEESEDDEKKPSLVKTDDIKPYDILCGRDKATFNNVGNRRFRVLISLNIPRYERATTKAEKASVIKYICDIFRNEVGVRFLKKHKNGEGYYELSVSEARKKVGHALRDMSVARQEVKKRRESMRRSSMRQHADYHRNTRTVIGQDLDPLVLEPLPISDQPASVEPNPEPRIRDHHQQMPVHWLDQQIKPSAVPDIIAQQLQSQHHGQQQQSHNHKQFDSLQEKLLDLQKQQEQLQKEREELLEQQQYQQELLELQIRNRRLRRQQEQMQQQQQRQLGDGFHQFDHFFDTRQQKRR